VTEITHRFLLPEIDHHELLAMLSLRYGTCWRVSEHEIAFPASEDHRLKVEIHHGEITKILSGKSLSDRELDELSEEVQVDLNDDQIGEYGAEILFASRPVSGAFHFTTIPMQILPAPPKAPRQGFGDHPFVIEYPVRRYRTPQVGSLRRRKNAVEWAWVLNALVRGSIRYLSSRPRQLWAIKSGEADGAPFWAQEFYMVPGFQGIRSGLSAQDQPLQLVAADTYFGDAKAQATLPIDTFYLPDNFDVLVGAFLKLDATRRRRFLRSAAAIYMAGEFWETSISSFFLACVQAIETLIDRPPGVPCCACGKDMGPGPTKLFREFVETYCRATEVDQRTLRNLYTIRSALAHGRYLFQLDEAPWGINIGATVASHHELELSRSALTVAKEGLRNWLLRDV
jgi:hypothetical protein